MSALDAGPPTDAEWQEETMRLANDIRFSESPLLALEALRAHIATRPVQEWSDAKLRGIASDYFPDAKDWPAAMFCMRHLLMEQAKYPAPPTKTKENGA